MSIAFQLRATDSTNGFAFWNQITWAPELGLFAAAGGTAACRIATSPDGTTWTSRTPTWPTGAGVSGLVWTGTQFVALLTTLGTTIALTSPDGITWTSQTGVDGTAGSWQGLAWSAALSLLVAVRSGGTSQVMTSPDGITWTARTAAVSSWKCVAWSPALALFVATSQAYTDTTRVMTSPDGITWTAQGTLPGQVQPSDLIWVPELALFVGVDSANVLASGNVVTSPDGLTWTQRATPAGRYGAVAWAAAVSQLCAVAETGAAAGFAAITSADGMTWTALATPSGADALTWTGIAYAPALNVFAAASSGGASPNIMSGPYASVTSLSPSTGTKRGGTLVRIVGVGLSTVATGDVLFDGTAATAVVPAADGLSVTCLTPAHAVGPVDVTVTGVGTLTAAYTYVSVDRVSPKAGNAAGGEAVTVTGYGFTAATGVLFGTSAATDVVIVSNTQITCTTPGHRTGTVDVTVSGVDVGSQLYTYELEFIFKQPVTQLPPLPKGPIAAANGLLSAEWYRWLNTAKQRIETPPSLVAEQVSGGGTFDDALIPDLAWSKVLKAGSSLGDLETRSGSDLNAGAVKANYGGTGLRSYTAGDLLYASAQYVLAALGIGAANTFLKSNGSLPAWAAGSALTKTDDTNVTLTLGGSAATALVNAASIALGWTGTLAPVRGGLGFDASTVAKGGVIVGTAAGTFGLKAVGSDGQVLTADSASTGGMKWGAPNALGTFNETPGGLVNGSNTAYTTAGAYQAGTLRVHLNGVRLASSDYTETSPSGGTFTMGTAPTTGDLLRVDYGGSGTAIDAANITSGTLPDARLSNTAVTPATYGDASHVSQVTVDAHGRITGAANVAISAGALIQISQIVTTASQATVDFTNIPGTYSALEIEWTSRDTQGGTGVVGFDCKINGDATAGNYTPVYRIGSQNAAAFASNLAASATGVQMGAHPQAGNTAGMVGSGSLVLIGYAGTTWHKRLLARFGSDDASSNGLTSMHNARWKSTAAITRVTFTSGGTAFKDGSVFTLYGRS